MSTSYKIPNHITNRIDTVEILTKCDVWVTINDDFESIFSNFLQTKYGISLAVFEKALKELVPEGFI